MNVVRSRMMAWFFVAAAVAAAAPARAAKSKEWGRDFGKLAAGISGGFQFWSLADVERAIDARNEAYANDGYHLGNSGFGPALAYGGELEYRLSKTWFTRFQMDWTRLSVDGRDRQYIQSLGTGPTPVSLDYETRVQTRPVLFELGLGRSWRNESLRFVWAGNLVIAPMKIVDKLTVYELDVTTNSDVQASGTGLGGAFTVGTDYFTDTNMNVFLELFGRVGHVDVTLDDPVYESTILPGTRRVGLGGAGLRMGFRWI